MKSTKAKYRFFVDAETGEEVGGFVDDEGEPMAFEVNGKGVVATSSYGASILCFEALSKKELKEKTEHKKVWAFI